MSDIELQSTAEKVVDDVVAEVNAGISKFGGFNSAHEGYAVIAEELDELWDLVKENRGYSLTARAEAIQVAAMAIRYVIDCCD